MKFKQSGDGSRVSTGPGVQIHQIKKYMFESSLKRMSVLCKVTESGAASYRVLTKGAPEVLKKFIKNPPADYDETYLKYVKNGARVLVLCQKRVQSMSQPEFQAYKRDQAECDLEFCGFLVAECPLKPDTAKVITELKNSSHEVKMITGDNQLTAAFIA